MSSRRIVRTFHRKSEVDAYCREQERARHQNDAFHTQRRQSTGNALRIPRPMFNPVLRTVRDPILYEALPVERKFHAFPAMTSPRRQSESDAYSASQFSSEYTSRSHSQIRSHSQAGSEDDLSRTDLGPAVSYVDRRPISTAVGGQRPKGRSHTNPISLTLGGMYPPPPAYPGCPPRVPRSRTAGPRGLGASARNITATGGVTETGRVGHAVRSLRSRDGPRRHSTSHGTTYIPNSARGARRSTRGGSTPRGSSAPDSARSTMSTMSARSDRSGGSFTMSSLGSARGTGGGSGWGSARGTRDGKGQAESALSLTLRDIPVTPRTLERLGDTQTRERGFLHDKGSIVSRPEDGMDGPDPRIIEMYQSLRVPVSREDMERENTLLHPFDETATKELQRHLPAVWQSMRMGTAPPRDAVCVLCKGGTTISSSPVRGRATCPSCGRVIE
ncbi:hypothetical protein KIPB_006367 [Kipferlia bialata]|uniref:Uncharacterized protein n=1 Tax=Kipferlia bialata TaxID=797122 RepID=A0A9K3CYV7_9EUKA|nr:hypothetical protein KIPB_006367 [Kipferlia bialata]|eukprot:g6367.t1